MTTVNTTATTFFLPTTTKHKDSKTIKSRVEGVNKKLKQKAVLYWIHTEEMTDPKSEGYVGVTTIDKMKKRFGLHQEEFVKAGLVDSVDDLKVVDLMTGTYGEMNAQEGVFRPYLGIGWNYLNGGGAVFGMSYLNPRNWKLWSSK